MKLISILILACFSYISWAGNNLDQDNLRRVAEYHISSANILTFSAGGASIKLCTTCEINNINIKPDTELFEQEKPINLKRATEIYIKKSYKVTHIGIDRKTLTALYFRFGGHPDDQ